MTAERDAARLWLVGGIAAAAGVVALGWFLVAAPQQEQIAATNDETQSLTVTNDVLEARVAQLAAAEENREQHERERDAALVLLPKMPATSEFSDLLEARTAATNVELTRYSTGDPIAEDFGDDARITYRIPVSFTLLGEIEPVEEFLDELQALDQRAVLLTSTDLLPLDGQQTGDIAGDVVASISGSIWVTPDAPLADAEGEGESSGDDG